MPAELKTHGEVNVKDAPARLDDTVLGDFEGVRIYLRKHPSGRTSVNGTHRERTPIEHVAGRLHAMGYGVKIDRFDLDAVPHFNFVAVWAGPGEPPALPMG